MPPRKTPKPVPIWDQKITSQAERERKRFKISMTSRDEETDEEINEEYIARMASTLVGGSRDTFGIQSYGPLEGTTAKKPTSRQAPMDVIPNSPSRSPILRVPLQVREKIYSYLLLYPIHIMVEPDWKNIEAKPFVDHSIILVCQQFSIEASAFLYKNNTFKALLREQGPRFAYTQIPATIAVKHHANFRNLIIDCSPACWDLRWHEKVARGLTNLVVARPMIESLTIIVNPQRVGKSTTCLGDQESSITFADFLWNSGPLMLAIRKVAPRVLKIVIKKGGAKRFGVEVDMHYFQAGWLTEGPLANKETIRLRDAHIQKVENQLMTLKERLEQVFEDDQLAVAEGICTVLPLPPGNPVARKLSAMRALPNSA